MQTISTGTAVLGVPVTGFIRNPRSRAAQNTLSVTVLNLSEGLDELGLMSQIPAKCSGLTKQFLMWSH